MTVRRLFKFSRHDCRWFCVVLMFVTKVGQMLTILHTHTVVTKTEWAPRKSRLSTVEVYPKRWFMWKCYSSAWGNLFLVISEITNYEDKHCASLENLTWVYLRKNLLIKVVSDRVGCDICSQKVALVYLFIFEIMKTNIKMWLLKNIS